MNKAGAVKKSLHATERDTPRVHALRSTHVEAIAQRADVARFHFLDETGLRLDYTRRCGRARGGRRVAGAVPLRRPAPALTLIGALSVRGLHGVQVLEGALNQHNFALYIGRILAPQLRRGDVLVLDNLRVHHLTGLREWLAQRGIEVLFLPPYSPDFTPHRAGLEQAQNQAAPSPGTDPRSARRSFALCPRLDYWSRCESVV